MSNWKERITTDALQCGGRPCIRGTRIRVIDVPGLLASGLTQEQVLQELPDLEPEDIEAALKYAGSKPDSVTAEIKSGRSSAHRLLLIEDLTKSSLVDLSGFKFDRDRANDYHS